MCYSARIKANLRDLSREFGAQVDISSFEALFRMRLKEPEVKIPRALDRYFLMSEIPEEKKLGPLVRQFHEEEEVRLRDQLKSTHAEIKDLTQGKVSAASRKKIETREKRILRLDQKISSTLHDISPLDERIYPFYYAPVIAVGKNGKTLVPMRYRVRGPGGAEVPNQYNVFNARIDSLESARTWKPLFGKTHAIFPFRVFFEWVERNGVKNEICFSPDDRSLMWAASLFAHAPGAHGPLLSFAMVTDDPPPEISEAGHDRCPIFLKRDQVDAWLHPAERSLKSLIETLQNKENPHYSSTLSA